MCGISKQGIRRTIQYMLNKETRKSGDGRVILMYHDLLEYLLTVYIVLVNDHFKSKKKCILILDPPSSRDVIGLKNFKATQNYENYRL